MSRYEFRNKENKDISIGWDRPMNTFFAQIHNPKAVKDSEYCELWMGAQFNQFTDLDAFLKEVPFEVGEELTFHLKMDQQGLTGADEIKPLPLNIIARHG